MFSTDILSFCFVYMFIVSVASGLRSMPSASFIPLVCGCMLGIICQYFRVPFQVKTVHLVLDYASYQLNLAISSSDEA